MKLINKGMEHFPSRFLNFFIKKYWVIFMKEIRIEETNWVFEVRAVKHGDIES